jgi:hypothetical protein
MLRKFEQAVDLYNQIEDLRLEITIREEEKKICLDPKTKKRIEWELLTRKNSFKIKQQVFINLADICITQTEILTALDLPS